MPEKMVCGTETVLEAGGGEGVALEGFGDEEKGREGWELETVLTCPLVWKRSKRRGCCKKRVCLVGANIVVV